MSARFGGCSTNTKRARGITPTHSGRYGCSNDGTNCSLSHTLRRRRRSWFTHDQGARRHSAGVPRRDRRARIRRYPVPRTARRAAPRASGRRHPPSDRREKAKPRARDCARPGTADGRRVEGNRRLRDDAGSRRSERADALRSPSPPGADLAPVAHAAGRRVQPAVRQRLRSRVRVPVDSSFQIDRTDASLSPDREGAAARRHARVRRDQRDRVGAAARVRARRVPALRRADAAGRPGDGARRIGARARLARRRSTPLPRPRAHPDARRAAFAADGTARHRARRSVWRRSPARMDCDMPPQVTYWTGVWQPGSEALSNEVQALRDLYGGRAPVVSFSSGQRSAVSVRDRVVRLSSARWAALRAVAAAVEPRGDVTHVFGARARARPEVDIVLLWRDWGSQRAANRALARLSPPDNIVVETKNGRSMPDIYRSADATVICYEDGFGKSCPNSIVEGVACGRPALVATTCALAPLIARSGAGASFSRDIDAAGAALDAVLRNYANMAVGARMLAVRHFDVDRFRLRYCELYARLVKAV